MMHPPQRPETACRLNLKRRRRKKEKKKEKP